MSAATSHWRTPTAIFSIAVVMIFSVIRAACCISRISASDFTARTQFTRQSASTISALGSSRRSTSWARAVK
jgi:hypothetical protein